jgi:hypothetical protein
MWDSVAHTLVLKGLVCQWVDKNTVMTDGCLEGRCFKSEWMGDIIGVEPTVNERKGSRPWEIN